MTGEPRSSGGNDRPPQRVTLVIGTLGGGGAERVVITIAEHWQRAGREVTIVTLNSSNVEAYDVPAGVARVDLGDHRVGRRPWVALSRLRALRAAVSGSNPDVVVSFIEVTNIWTVVAMLGRTPPVIVCEEIEPRAHRIALHLRLLRRLTYPFAACVVVRAEATRPWAQKVIGRRRVAVIPNPLALEPIARAAGSSRKVILGMGRLDHQKGFDLLIREFADLALDFPDWDVVIRGDGPQQSALECLASEHGLAQRVSLPGFSNDPASDYAAADLFVLSSRYEGFGIVLLEAMACGVPCIAFDCPSGPSEMIENGVDGILVPPGDVDGLAAQMRRLMGDPDERSRLGANAQRVRDRYSVDVIMREWDLVISSARVRRRRGRSRHS